MIYTGIGSRKTPEDILQRMRWYAHALARMNATLRSGGAPGADSAFEEGCRRATGYPIAELMEIYLPWKGFNHNPSPLHNISKAALEYAADIYGPRWQYLKRPVKNLMARNIYQVLGENLDTPSDCVVCWTPDGCISAGDRSAKTGGTGQAITCAYELDIPIFNFQREEDDGRFIEFLKEHFANDQTSEVSKG